MIVRQLLTRQGGRSTALLSKSWTRSLASEVGRAGLPSSKIELDAFSAVPSSNVEGEVLFTVPSSSEQGSEVPSESDAFSAIPSEGDAFSAIPSSDTPGDEFSAGMKRIKRREDTDVKGRYHDLGNLRRQLRSIGGDVIKQVYRPEALVSYPPGPSDITLELLLASQSHLGHATPLWNPANSRYIFGIRQGIHIISLDVTASHLRRACRVASGVTERGGLVLFVGTRPGQDTCVVNAAKRAKGCHLFERWTPGSITNAPQILGRCKMKMVDEFDREIKGFERELHDRPPLRPDLVVCLNPMENWVMLHECALNGIPTMGIIDTNANPTWVTYPIPANDDSLRCTQLIAGVLGKAGQEGQRLRKEKAQEGIVTYTPIILGAKGRR